MSEKAAKHHEKHEAVHSKEADSHLEKLHSSNEKKAKNAKHEHSEKIEKIRSDIEKTAKSAEHHAAPGPEEKEPNRPVLINKELRNVTYKRTLKRTQSKLPTAQKALSKIIHQPLVESVSDATSKTVARPSGVFMGGLFAFLGSSVFLWVSKHYGYEYNFFIFMMFFIGGFFIGLLVELGLNLANKRSR